MQVDDRPDHRSSAERVLENVWDGKFHTTSTLMELTGHSRSTVIKACDELIARRWIRRSSGDLSEGRKAMGRPENRYALRSEAGVVVGVDAGPHRIAVRVADLVGVTVSDASVEAPSGRSRCADWVRIIEGTVLGALEVTTAPVLSVSVGTPARVDEREALPQGEVDLWQSLHRSLQARFSARSWPSVFENDANLAAIACTAMTDSANFITLLSRETLGAGIILGGQLLRGAYGRAGNLLLLRSITDVGSTEGITSLIGRWAGEGGFHVAGKQSASNDESSRQDQLDALLAAVVSGDRGAAMILDRLGVRFGLVLATLAGILDVDAIVLAGAPGPALEEILRRATPTARGIVGPLLPRLLASVEGEGIVVAGAVSSALTMMRSRAFTTAL